MIHEASFFWRLSGIALASRRHKMDAVNIVYRKALPEDSEECVEIRGRTRENAITVERLKELGVTLQTWRDGIQSGTLPGYVCLSNGQSVGYCFGARHTGEILVLAVLPACEGMGIGRTLLNAMVQDFKDLGFNRLFLGCSADSQTRSYGFYRHLGRPPTGTFDPAQDEVLEYFP